MTFPLPVGPLTPYVSPAMLTAAPTGISWSTIPSIKNSSFVQQQAEQYNICQRASAQADGYCNQVLRATADTEYVQGPDYYVTYQQYTGNTRIILQRWPVLAITAAQVSLNSAFPRQWQSIPAGNWDIERPVMGVYGSSSPSGAGGGGQAILLAPGNTSWCAGRKGFVLKISYVNGWPHTSLTGTAVAGATTVTVDDCTGWAVTTASGITGAVGNIYDTEQEAVQVVSASAPSGPGTLTLSAGLTFNHAQGAVLTTVPATIQWACILFATAIALTRGATATTIHTIPGGGAPAPALKGPDSLVAEGELLLHPFRRTI